MLRKVELDGDLPADEYPFGLAAIRSLPLELSSRVTVLVGENGSGKSTLIEAIAVAAGFNPEGGSGQVRFDELETVGLWRSLLNDPTCFLRHLH